MEELISGESSNEEEEEIENRKWPISDTKEKEFWDENIINDYIYMPDFCPTFKKGKMSIRENNKNKICNPYLLVCKNKVCKRKINLRKYSFFSLNPKIPVSVICFIIYNFLILKLNAEQIKQAIIEKYKTTLSYKSLYSIIHNIRHVITDYLKTKYRSRQIGGPPESNKKVAVDESLFIALKIMNKFGSWEGRKLIQIDFG